MKETLFRFNPFNIANWTNEQVKEQYDIFAESLIDSDNSIALATNIDLYANMGYLIGEMIARYYQDVSITEAEYKVSLANEITKSRNQWLKEHSDKPPAMSFFENQVMSKQLDELKELTRLETNLKRFKYAYESIDQKQNALKKKLESIKYDTIGR